MTPSEIATATGIFPFDGGSSRGRPREAPSRPPGTVFGAAPRAPHHERRRRRLLPPGNLRLSIGSSSSCCRRSTGASHLSCRMSTEAGGVAGNPPGGSRCRLRCPRSRRPPALRLRFAPAVAPRPRFAPRASDRCFSGRCRRARAAAGGPAPQPAADRNPPSDSPFPRCALSPGRPGAPSQRRDPSSTSTRSRRSTSSGSSTPRAASRRSRRRRSRSIRRRAGTHVPAADRDGRATPDSARARRRGPQAREEGRRGLGPRRRKRSGPRSSPSRGARSPAVEQLFQVYDIAIAGPGARRRPHRDRLDVPAEPGGLAVGTRREGSEDVRGPGMDRRSGPPARPRRRGARRHALLRDGDPRATQQGQPRRASYAGRSTTRSGCPRRRGSPEARRAPPLKGIRMEATSEYSDYRKFEVATSSDFTPEPRSDRSRTPARAPRSDRSSPPTLPEVSRLARGQLGYAAPPRASPSASPALEHSPSHALLVAEAAEGRIAGWIHVEASHALIHDPARRSFLSSSTRRSRGRGIGAALVARPRRGPARAAFAGCGSGAASSARTPTGSTGARASPSRRRSASSRAPLDPRGVNTEKPRDAGDGRPPASRRRSRCPRHARRSSRKRKQKRTAFSPLFIDGPDRLRRVRHEVGGRHLARGDERRGPGEETDGDEQAADELDDGRDEHQGLAGHGRVPEEARRASARRGRRRAAPATIRAGSRTPTAAQRPLSSAMVLLLSFRSDSGCTVSGLAARETSGGGSSSPDSDGPGRAAPENRGAIDGGHEIMTFHSQSDAGRVCCSRSRSPAPARRRRRQAEEWSSDGTRRHDRGRRWAPRPESGSPDGETEPARHRPDRGHPRAPGPLRRAPGRGSPRRHRREGQPRGARGRRGRRRRDRDRRQSACRPGS